MSKWTVKLSARFKDGTVEELGHPQVSLLLASSSPFEFMQEFAKVRRKEFASLDLELNKSGTFDKKDLKVILEMSQLISQNNH